MTKEEDVVELTGLLFWSGVSSLRCWKICLSKSSLCSSAAAPEQASSILRATWKHCRTENGQRRAVGYSLWSADNPTTSASHQSHQHRTGFPHLLKYHIPRPRTELGKSAFSFAAPSTWNNPQAVLKMLELVPFNELCRFLKNWQQK